MIISDEISAWARTRRRVPRRGRKKGGRRRPGFPTLNQEITTAPRGRGRKFASPVIERAPRVAGVGGELHKLRIPIVKSHLPAAPDLDSSALQPAFSPPPRARINFLRDLLSNQARGEVFRHLRRHEFLEKQPLETGSVRYN